MKKITASTIPNIDSKIPPIKVRIKPRINNNIFMIRPLNTKKQNVIDKNVRILSIFCCCGVSSTATSFSSETLQLVASQLQVLFLLTLLLRVLKQAHSPFQNLQILPLPDLLFSLLRL